MNKEIFNTNTILVSIISLISGVILGRFLKLTGSSNRCSKFEATAETPTTDNNKKEEEEEDYEEDDDNMGEYDEEDDEEIEYDEEIGDCKQVLVIRTDLGMTKGKIIAQCCHASLGARQKALKDTKKVLRQWENFGCAKITLKANSKEELLELRNSAKEHGVVNYLVLDAGHTQIPNGSATVLAIGPAPKDKVDAVAKHLKLY